MDLVEIRLNELSPIVEKFVIVESTTTFTGRPKRLVFADNYIRFEKFLPRIIHLVYQGVPEEGHHWANEIGQRNYILEALKFSHPSDGLLHISDADEIPRPTSLLQATAIAEATQCPVALELADCMYYLDYASKGFHREPFLYNPDKITAFNSQFTNAEGQHPPDDPAHIRFHIAAQGHYDEFPTIKQAGWHFTMMGGNKSIRRKLAAYSHVELNLEELTSDEHLDKCRIEGTRFLDKVFSWDKNATKFEKQGTSFLPKYIQSNLEKYRHLLCAP